MVLTFWKCNESIGFIFLSKVYRCSSPLMVPPPPCFLLFCQWFHTPSLTVWSERSVVNPRWRQHVGSSPESNGGQPGFGWQPLDPLCFFTSLWVPCALYPIPLLLAGSQILNCCSERRCRFSNTRERNCNFPVLGKDSISWWELPSIVKINFFLLW